MFTRFDRRWPLFVTALLASVILVAGASSTSAQEVVTRTWIGSADLNWFTATNWNPAGVPADGDAVVVSSSSAFNIRLTNSTANLGSFSITNRTLTFTNWSTTVSATNIQILNGATITLPAAFTNTQMSNRVAFACTDFLLAKGGVIDANAKGFAGGTTTVDGHGPGGGKAATYAGGAGHGGAGGDGSGTGAGAGVQCGVASAPVLPGSGGGGSTSANGGGAVWISAAAGAVTIHGEIKADGANAAGNGGGGSGGSIYIQCQTFSGSSNGLLTAKGGRGNGTSNNGSGGGGSGGRIAVVYNPVAQAGMDVPDVRFNVDFGRRHTSSYPTSEDGDMGTLYLPDARFLTSAPANFQRARIVGVTNWFPANIALTNVLVWFDEPGFELRTPGDILCDTGAQLVLPPHAVVHCGGDLVLTNGGSLKVFGGVTNELTALYGALVSVTGSLQVAAGSWVYPHSAIATNPPGFRPMVTNNATAVPLFRMNSLWVAPGGGFDADRAGFTGGDGSYVNGFGPGGGIGSATYGGGGGHGGQGGKGTGANGGGVYDSANAPVQPGSGGGKHYGAPGGGGIRLDVVQTATIEGTMTANGHPGQGDLSYGGGGAGGSVFLMCNVLELGTGAVLRANGGPAGTKTAGTGGSGGGGRVAIAVGLAAADRQSLVNGAAIPGATIFNSHAPSLATISALGALAGGDGTNGTVVILTTNNVLTIKSDPAEAGLPWPQRYGKQSHAAEWITNSVPSPTDRVNGAGWSCLGWTLVPTAGGDVVSGSGTQVVVQLTNHMDLTWRWTNEYELVVSSSAETDGSVNSVAVNGWYTNGVSVTNIVATPSNGYAFTQWTGTVPPGQEHSNPLTVVMTNARTLTAVFNLSEGGVTKTWTGTGAWENSSNWAPNGMPGSSDEVIIQSGTVIVGAARAVQSVEIQNTATLVFTNWGAKLTASNVTVRGGGSITLPDAFTDSAMSNRVHVVCTNFMLETNATIQASGRGHAGGDTGVNGYGTGAGGVAATIYYGGGGGHGGFGGDGSSGPASYGGIAFDTVGAPEFPGSGGAGTQAGAGGGAVRIDAADTVTIHGTITADGLSSSSYGGGGAGGSIWITCANIAGTTNGLLTAKGGNSGAASGGGGGGGGGRIAVVYGSAQPVPGVRFQLARGLRTTPQLWAEDGEEGTLYLPDATFLSETMSNVLSARLYFGAAGWSADSLTLTNKTVWFGEEGFNLTITNNIVIGAGASLVLPPYSVLNCGGSLTLTNGGSLRVFGGVTNASPPDYGALVSVTNDMVIGAGSWVYPHPAYVSNSPGYPPQLTNTAVAVPLFRMNRLSIASGGGFNANHVGFAGGMYDISGWGTGKGLATSAYGGGGGFGGNGGPGSTGTGGGPYGRTNAPVQPGSGGGGRYATAGGGGIRIEVRDLAEIAGTLTANGRSGVTSISYGGGGSGGSVFLQCGDLLTTADTSFSAMGGNAGTLSGQTGGGGGGGRIAVWIGDFTESQRNTLLADGIPPRMDWGDSHAKFLGTVLSVTNGINTAYPARDGFPGTVVFISPVRAAGSVFLIR